LESPGPHKKITKLTSHWNKLLNFHDLKKKCLRIRSDFKRRSLKRVEDQVLELADENGQKIRFVWRLSLKSTHFSTFEKFLVKILCRKFLAKNSL
jgi:hypothetical protein